MNRALIIIEVESEGKPEEGMAFTTEIAQVAAKAVRAFVEGQPRPCKVTTSVPLPSLQTVLDAYKPMIKQLPPPDDTIPAK